MCVGSILPHIPVSQLYSLRNLDRDKMASEDERVNKLNSLHVIKSLLISNTVIIIVNMCDDKERIIGCKCPRSVIMW